MEHLDRLKVALADRYAIREQIGAGGMATVYLAEDLKHERDVAIKVLRPELAAILGGERFLHEIKISAKLQHPHIVTLIDSGEADGLLYYVMPVIVGESLRAKINREKLLAIDVAIDIVTQVAGALQHAHDQGVIHRDIKPENILLDDGNAMVSDFGIALALTAAGGTRLTETGLSLGTPEYMSPEQATADQDVDHRSDVYSLGAVMYEMLTGEPPVTGKSVQAIIARLLTERPTQPSTIRETVPQFLDAAVMKALAKTPIDRPQSVQAFAQDLRGSDAEGTDSHRPTSKRSLRWPMVARTTALGAVLLLVIMAAVILMSNDRNPLAVPLYRQLTFSGGVGLSAVSPDGQMLAFVTGSRDTANLVVQAIDGGRPLEIASVWSVGGLKWAPDGSRLLVYGIIDGRWGTYLFPRLGGSPQRLNDGFAFSPDGSQLVDVNRYGLEIIDVATGVSDTIALGHGDRQIGGPTWSPTGEHIAFIVRESDREVSLVTVTLEGGRQETLVRDSLRMRSPFWSAGGNAVYYISGAEEIRRVSVNPRTGKPRGGPVSVLASLEVHSAQWAGGPVTQFTITDDGRHLVYARAVRASNLWLVVRDGSETELRVNRLTSGTAEKCCASVSPDGTSFVYLQEGPSGVENAFRMPIAGGAPQQLTFSGASQFTAWSSDGTQIAFGTVGERFPKVGIISSNGGPVRILQNTRANNGTSLAWAPGERIVYHMPGNRNLELVDPVTEEKHQLLTNDSLGWIFQPRYSPDGEQLAVSWNRIDGQRGYWIMSLRDSTQFRVRGGSGYPHGWTSDGTALFVNEIGSQDLLRIRADGAAETVVATLPENCDLQYVAPDGNRMLCIIDESTSDVWVIENFDPSMQ